MRLVITAILVRQTILMFGLLDDVEVSLISLPRLKENKKASGRFKDLNDLEHLP